MTPATAARDAEWDLMATSGVESVRAALYWPSGAAVGIPPPDLSHYDALVLAGGELRHPGAADRPRHAGLGGTEAGRRTSPPRDPAPTPAC